MLGHGPDAVGVGDRGAAVLLDDQGHGCHTVATPTRPITAVPGGWVVRGRLPGRSSRSVACRLRGHRQDGNDRRRTARLGWPSWSASSGAAAPARRTSASGVIVVVALAAAFGLSRLDRPATPPSRRRTPPCRRTAPRRPSRPAPSPGRRSRARRRARPPTAPRPGPRASRTRRPCASTRPRPTPRRSRPTRAPSPSRSTRRRRPHTVNNFVVLSRYHFYDGHPVPPHRARLRRPGRRSDGHRRRRPRLQVRRRAAASTDVLQDRLAWPWPTRARTPTAASSSSSSADPGSRARQLLAVRPGHRRLRHHRQGAWRRPGRPARRRSSPRSPSPSRDGAPSAGRARGLGRRERLAARPRRRRGGRPRRRGAPIAAADRSHGGACGQRDRRGKARPEAEGAVEAVVRPRLGAGDDGHGRARPRPSVKAPPRGSVIGSHSAMAAGPEAATTAPVGDGRHQGVPQRGVLQHRAQVHRRVAHEVGEPALPDGRHVLRREGVRAGAARPGPGPSRRGAANQDSARVTDRSGCSKASAVGRTSTDRAPARASSWRSSASVAANSPPPINANVPVTGLPSPCAAPPGRCRRATPATQDRSGRVSVVRPKRSMLRIDEPGVADRAREVAAGHEAVGHDAPERPAQLGGHAGRPPGAVVEEEQLAARRRAARAARAAPRPGRAARSA